MFSPPKLGVGMIYATALESFLMRSPGMLDVLEFEPQTMWIAKDALNGPFEAFQLAVDLFKQHKCKRLLHSVGVPLAGSRLPSPLQMELLAGLADELGSPWVSEHLSVGGTPHQSAGFLMPPLQTEAGMETAVRNILMFRNGVGRPVAVETGVSYLRRQPFEMDDGAFVAGVAETADCGILLDLHNVYCNDRNGRFPLERFVGQLPLDRVWEVHLAGGAEADGFWLDAHSGPMPRELAERARRVVRALPSLGALNFEIYSTFLERIGPDVLAEILDEVKDIWSEAGRASGDWIPVEARLNSAPAGVRKTWRGAPLSQNDWDQMLQDALADSSDLAAFPSNDPAMPLYRWLIRSFRGSMLARIMPRAFRYLFLRDAAVADALMQRFFAEVSPQLYASLEGRSFQKWLAMDAARDDIAAALVDYDLALAEMPFDPVARIVSFPGDPRAILEALANFELPETPEPPAWEVELLPDMPGGAAETGYLGAS